MSKHTPIIKIRNKHTPTIGESLTQQHYKEETDINNIMSKYMKTGVLGNPNATRQPQFGDYSSIDFMEMRNAVADIDQSFLSLSAKIRNRFQNDPHQLIRFIEKPENQAEALKLGLLYVEPNLPADATLTPSDPEANPKPKA